MKAHEIWKPVTHCQFASYSTVWRLFHVAQLVSASSRYLDCSEGVSRHFYLLVDGREWMRLCTQSVSGFFFWIIFLYLHYKIMCISNIQLLVNSLKHWEYFLFSKETIYQFMLFSLNILILSQDIIHYIFS